ncbi:MAG: excinuclease ABC subunit UvrC [Acidobacteria bacterium]|nr:excinuclease ABC subunit UvrC [Acidobacteriota bacterium]
MDLQEKIRTLPTSPGVYLYKNAEGEIIYVGKAQNLRSRVRSYFSGDFGDSKTGSLLREAVDVEYIIVDNNKEALALENNFIKQKKPRFNILLRDDKTYPYIKLTAAERYPRVYVTRRLKRDGGLYFGPYFPTSLAYRLVDLIHRHFLVPSCTVDLTRTHPRPCLQYYIKRCLGPCVEGLTTAAHYSEAVRDVKLLLEGRAGDLGASLRERMSAAAGEERYEQAAKYRDLISTIELMEQRQRIAAVEGDDADVFGYHLENGMLSVNVFHVRGGKVLDRRELFWEKLPEHHFPNGQFDTAEFFASLLMQLYLNQQYVPRNIYVPVDFADREPLEELLSENGEARVHITVPQRGEKRSLIDLAGKNARQSFDQRFRVLKPRTEEVKEALQEALMLAEKPQRIECFDISHIQGAETVASMVVWEDGRMKKSDYRKFIIRSVEGVDDFASMREVVMRRYKRLLGENQPLPSVILIDGGVGQLHAAAQALDELGILNQPVASIAKREEIIYVAGQEDEPVILDHHSPVLHVVQMIRDEAHRFAVGFHRKRREMRDRDSELLEIPGVGERTRQRLLEHFGSVRAVREANAAALAAVVNKNQAAAILQHFARQS